MGKKEEINLVLQIYFVWKYYLEYFLNLMYNPKKEFYDYKNCKNLNNELTIQFTYILVGLITVNIILLNKTRETEKTNKVGHSPVQNYFKKANALTIENVVLLKYKAVVSNLY